VDVRDGVLVDIKMTGHGCSISQASSSLMSAAVKGRPLDEVRATIESFKTMMGLREASLSEGQPSDDVDDLRSMKEINALAGVVKFPVRIKCATLAWNTLEQALGEAS
jgi:nitrogen fixation NifU-like protein